MDRGRFERFLATKRLMEPVTIKRTLERYEYAKKHGFDVDRFLRGPLDAEEAGTEYLVDRLQAGVVHAYNNDTKWLNNLAKFLGYGISFKSRPEPKSAPRALTPNQVRQLLTFHYPGSYPNLFRRALLQFDTIVGARPSEISMMGLEDVDEDQSRIFIRKPAKGGKQRWLPMPSHLWQPNRPFAAYLKQRLKPKDDRDALWTTGLGQFARANPRRVDPDVLRNVLTDVSLATGVKATFNILRHTVGTELLRRTGNLRWVQYWLGHTSITSTAVYAEVSYFDLAHSLKRNPAPDYYQA